MGLKLRHKLAWKLREGPQWKSWQIPCHIAAKGPAMPEEFKRICRHGHAQIKNEQTEGICPRTFLKKLPA